MGKVAARSPEGTSEVGTRVAVLYAAKSTEDIHGSIPTQLEDCRELARRNGWEIAREFTDEAFSAFSGNRGPGLSSAKKLAIAIAAERGGCILVAQDTDRFARGAGDAPDAAQHLGELFFAMKRQLVTLWTVRTGELDSLRASFEGERGTDESSRKQQAVRAGKRRQFERGDALGPVHDGYRLVPVLDEAGNPVTENTGRVVMRRELDPNRAPLMLRVFDLVEEGASFGDVARALNREGIRTRRGKTWTTRRIRETIHDPYYCGQIVLHGARKRGKHPALIDTERFERIQASLRRIDPAAAQRRQGGRRPAEFFLLRGIAHCARCGLPMYTRRQRGQRVYVCRAVRQCEGTCDAPVVWAEQAEGEVIAYLHHFIEDLGGWIGQKLSEHRGERAILERAAADEAERLRKLDRERAKLLVNARKQLAASESLGRLALEAVQCADDDRDRQKRRLAETEAALAEWTARPDADLTLDAYRELYEFVTGRLSRATTAEDMHAALHSLLETVTMQIAASGALCMDFTLRDSDAVLTGTLPKSVRMTRTKPRQVAPTLGAVAKEDARPSCRSTRSGD
jgi:DNA invertase Pin-like site-specific DNA recombinase